MKLRAVTCPSCGGEIDIDLNGREFVFCPYCGRQIHVDCGKTVATINKNINIKKTVTQTKRYEDEAGIIREREKGKENKRGWIALIVCAVIAIGIPFGMLFKFDIEEAIASKQGKVSVGFYRDLEGQNYESIEAHFRAAGFDDIQLIDLGDYGLLFWTDGDVEQISIEGNTTFESTDYFSPDSTVVISYH